MMGASTRNTAAMRTSMGIIMGTYGERKRKTQTDSHPVLRQRVFLIMVFSESDTDLVRPVELWLLYLEVKKSTQGDGIEKPGSETAMKRNVRHTRTGCTFLQQ